MAFDLLQTRWMSRNPNDGQQTTLNDLNSSKIAPQDSLAQHICACERDAFGGGSKDLFYRTSGVTLRRTKRGSGVLAAYFPLADGFQYLR
ncbi:MAG: hypothetical protein C4334_10230 [Pyrinomonas sp.]